MKKTVLILAIALVLAFMFTLTASATNPDNVEGYVPLSSLFLGEEYLEYDVCDEYAVGHVVQPIAPPGFAVHGTFTFGDIPDEACTYEPQYTGTCELTLIPVEDFMNPESKKGRGVVGRCTDVNLHGRYVINYDYTYEAWYHIDP